MMNYKEPPHEHRNRTTDDDGIRRLFSNFPYQHKLASNWIKSRLWKEILLTGRRLIRPFRQGDREHYMKTLIIILGVWVTAMICTASYKMGYEYALDASWKAYADQYVAEHVAE